MVAVKSSRLFIPLGIVLMVAGCGGGGSSSGGNGGIVVPTTPVPITSSNANTVASNANTAASVTYSEGKTTSRTLVGVIAQQSGSRPSVLSVVTSEFDRLFSAKLPTSSVVGITGTSSNACSISGSYTETDVVANGIYLRSGDTATITYNNCVYTAGVVLNGTLSFAIGTMVGTGIPYTSANFTVTFTNFSMTYGSETVALNGDMTISTSYTGNVMTSNIHGTSFAISDTVGTNTNSLKVYGANGYSMTYTYDKFTTVYTYSVNMQVASTAMNGSVTIATPTTFQGTAGIGMGYPSAGVMTITGSNGSSLTVTTVDSTSVTLSGTNGTTSFGPIPVAWSAL